MNKKNVIFIIDNNVDVDVIVAIATYLKKHNIKTKKVALTPKPVVNKQNISVAADAYLEDIDLEDCLAICIPNFFDVSIESNNANLLNAVYKLYMMNKLIITIGNGSKLVTAAFEGKNIDTNQLPADKVLHFNNQSHESENASFFKKLLNFLTVERVQTKPDLRKDN